MGSQVHFSFSSPVISFCPSGSLDQASLLGHRPEFLIEDRVLGSRIHREANQFPLHINSYPGLGQGCQALTPQSLSSPAYKMWAPEGDSSFLTVFFSHVSLGALFSSALALCNRRIGLSLGSVWLVSPFLSAGCLESSRNQVPVSSPQRKFEPTLSDFFGFP